MNNRKKLLTTLVLLLALVVVYVFIFTPLKDSNNDLSEQVAELEGQVNSRQDSFDTDDDTADKIGEISQQILDIAIPSRFDQDDLIEQISELAQENNVKLDTISFGRGATESQFINSVNISMGVSGGLFSFLEFLHDLEAQERFYNIQNFNLSIGEELPKQVNFSVSLEVYHS